MSNTRIFYNNLADTATLGTASEDSNLVVENIQDEHIAKVYRTTTAHADEYITFDFTTAQSFDTIIVAGHNLSASDTNLAWYYSDDGSSWTKIADLTHVSTPIIGVESATISHRYAKLTFTRSDSNTRDIGRVFIGSHISIDCVDYGGYAEMLSDAANIDIANSGVEYGEIRHQKEEYELSCSMASNTEMSNIKTAFETVGKHTPLFIRIDDSSPFNTVLYVRFADDISRKYVTHESYWEVSLKFREQI